MSAFEPISDRELDGLFQSTLRLPIALAVSGGADSVALLQLVARWMRLTSAPIHVPDGRTSVLVLTVDHHLRPHSGDEARWVKDEAQRLGFGHITLNWDGPAPPSGLQAAAREARYRLMRACLAAEVCEYSSAAGTLTKMRDVVTAHHQDDQAETFLMRLARGSGIDGLSGMPVRSGIFGLSVVRPLLGLSKGRLLATLAVQGHRWIEDPSNDKLDFERVRVRKAASELAALGLSNEALTLSARRIARAKEALDAATEALSRAAGLELHGGAYAELKWAPFLAAPAELRVRLLTRLFNCMGARDAPVRLSQIEDVVAELEHGPHQGITLGGCIVSAGPSALRVFREPGRANLPELVLTRGEVQIWDGRFRVALTDAEGGPFRVRVRALGALSRPELEGLGKGWPHRALVSLPAFWEGERLLAVPHLGYAAPQFAQWVSRHPPGFAADFLQGREPGGR